MGCAVRTNEGEDGRQYPNQTAQALRTPPATVVEGREDLASRRDIRQDPEHDKDGEEAADVQNQDNTFEEREPRRKECVEDDREGQHGPDDECSLPSSWTVIRVDQGSKTLYDGTSKISDGRIANLPSKDTEPANDV